MKRNGVAVLTPHSVSSLGVKQNGVAVLTPHSRSFSSVSVFAACHGRRSGMASAKREPNLLIVHFRTLPLVEGMESRYSPPSGWKF